MKKRKFLLKLQLSALVLLLSFSAFSQTIYVDSSATGTNAGTSWANAFTDLQDALDASMARSGIDTILIAEGTYYPTQSPDGTTTDARDRAFHLADSNVVILGGYDATAGTQTGGATILSGDIGTVGDPSDNCYHVIITKGLSAATVMDKITMTAGNANGSGSLSYASVTFLKIFGGGIFNSSSSPTLTNCVFSSNSANYGGGIFNSSSSPTLTNCVFSSNSASGSYSAGGGMYNDASSSTLTNCLFSSNSVSGSNSIGGGGMYNSYSSLTLTNCAFSSNSASRGGGMSNYYSSSQILTNCSFTSNSASDGGGMYDYGSSSLTLTNCSFTSNSAGTGGGMYNVSSPTLTNCVFTSNSALYYGGGMYNYPYSSPRLTNCVFTSNNADYGGGMYSEDYCSPVLTNCAFMSNAANWGGGGIFNYDYARPVLTNTFFFKNTSGYGSAAIESYYSGGLNSSSTHNASDADLGVFPNTIIDLAGKYYKDLFADSTDLDGADDIWGTADDGFRLVTNAILRASGTAAGAPALDITGYTRPTPPSIGPYEFNPSSFAQVDSPPTVSGGSICPGGNINLGITGSLNGASKWYIYTGSCGGTILDSTSSNSFNVSPSSNTTYYIRGEGNSITSPGACGSATVIVYTDFPVITNLTSSRNPVTHGYTPYECADLTATASGGNGSVTYTWTPSGSGNTLHICPTMGAWYQLTVTDSLGCTDTMSIKQGVIEATSPYSGRVLICYQYPRRPNYYTMNVLPSQVSYYVGLGATLGACGSVPSKRGGSDFAELEGLYKVYPNPFSNELNLEFFNMFTEQVNITLTDMTGRVVKTIYNGMVYEGELSSMNVDATDLNNSMYLVRYSSNSDVRINKIQLIR